MKIRKYNEKYKEDTRKVITEVLTEFFGNQIIKGWEDFYEYGLFLVAEKNNKIVGTAALKDMKNGTGKLKRMYIIKEYRQRGIGQKLLDLILNFAKKNNINRIILSTEKRLIRAHNFYKKNGFIEMKEINWNSDFNDLHKEDVYADRMIAMEKKL